MNDQTVSPEVQQDPFYRVAEISQSLMVQKQILLDGYNELIRLLETPGNIDKHTLMQSIGRTLKNASK